MMEFWACLSNCTASAFIARKNKRTRRYGRYPNLEFGTEKQAWRSQISSDSARFFVLFWASIMCRITSKHRSIVLSVILLVQRYFVLFWAFIEVKYVKTSVLPLWSPIGLEEKRQMKNQLRFKLVSSQLDSKLACFKPVKNSVLPRRLRNLVTSRGQNFPLEWVIQRENFHRRKADKRLHNKSKTMKRRKS